MEGQLRTTRELPALPAHHSHHYQAQCYNLVRAASVYAQYTLEPRDPE